MIYNILRTMVSGSELLTAAEKKLLLAFKRGATEYDPRTLAELTGTNENAVIQTAFILMHKGFCDVKERRKTYYSLTAEGEEYAKEGLPERRALRLLLQNNKQLPLDELKSALGKRVNIAINWLLKKKWAHIDEGTVISNHDEEPPYGLDEKLLQALAAGAHDELPGEESIAQLIARRLVNADTRIERRIAITDRGMELLRQGIAIEDEIAQLTPELIRTWRGRKFKRYDINIPGRAVFAAKLHPYQRMLDRMRRIFTEMGFVEIRGDLIQSAFWNFDALFVPQDHPAREMQDTFYLGLKRPIDAPDGLITGVKQMHEHGGTLKSSGWGGEWKRELGEELLLRTHTTAVTVRYLASHPEPPVKVFCIGRVYRRETIDPTHIPEFDQLEGIVMDRNVTFANLLGCLATFYRKMGFPSIRFRPGYFPYTEPSVEVEVHTARGWIELGGAGIFRQEVTQPIGVKYPVLAWGLGIGRLAMISLGMSDIRDLYQPDIEWLRRAWLLPTLSRD